MVAPAKRQLPVGVSKSVRDPNGGAVALRDLSAIDAPNFYSKELEDWQLPNEERIIEGALKAMA